MSKNKKYYIVVTVNSLIAIMFLPIYQYVTAYTRLGVLFENMIKGFWTPLIVISVLVFLVLKTIESIFLEKTKKNRFTAMLIPCVIWAVLIIMKWYLFDANSNNFSSLSFITILFPLLVYIINITFETIIDIFSRSKED